MGTKIELVENVLKPEDFVRLRANTGFADIPVEHARRIWLFMCFFLKMLIWMKSILLVS